MIRQLAAEHALLGIALVELVVVLCLFGGIVLWTYRKGANQKYQAMANLPLESENQS